MKSMLFKVYLSIGIVVCLWFSAAAALGWKAPDFGIVKALNTPSGGGGGYYGGGRSIGGSWGGGK